MVLILCFSAIARSVMISASALDTRTRIGVSRFSAIARSVMISAGQQVDKQSLDENSFSAIARSVMISAIAELVTGAVELKFQCYSS